MAIITVIKVLLLFFIREVYSQSYHLINLYSILI